MRGAAGRQPGANRRPHIPAGDKRLDEWVAPGQLQPMSHVGQQALPLAHAHSLPAV